MHFIGLELSVLKKYETPLLNLFIFTESSLLYQIFTPLPNLLSFTNYVLFLCVCVCVCEQLRAPGCPVVIVGTHLDALPDSHHQAKTLEAIVWQKYSNSTHYPKVNKCEVLFILCVSANKL